MEKNLLIFGATGYLGSRITKILCEKDYKSVFLFARDLSSLEHDERITAIKIKDFSVEENVTSAFSHIIPDRSAFYFLISTIGGYIGGKSVKETAYKDWLTLQKNNLNASFLLAKHFSRLVEHSSGGSICFIGARAGLFPERNNAAYGISKSGLNYLTKVLALEGKSYNLSANTIAPYIIDSPENREWVKDKSEMVDPDKIAELVHGIFTKYDTLTGNIFEIPFTIT
ncbi:MAG: SDR family NAD(P)-dependent oxidoreductase [bacterium]